MNRYQFENYISEYLDNTLSIAKRKEFETYIAENPEAEKLVVSVRQLKSQLRDLPDVKTSSGFTDTLLKRIKSQQIQSTVQSKRKSTFLGFTPVVTGLISLVLIAIVVISIDLLPENTPLPGSFQSADSPANDKMRTLATDPSVQPNPNFTLIADEDSTLFNDNDSNRSVPIEDKIQFVKNPQ
jgi:anti-sigma-K factor RskA